MTDDSEPFPQGPRALPSHEDEYALMLRELPRLQRARAFAAALDRTAYFGRLGEPLDAQDTIAARHFLDGLGFPDAEPALLGDWRDAAEAALTHDVDPQGWEAEEMARAALTADALAVIEEEGLRVALALVADKASGAAKLGVEDAAALGDADADVELLNAAVGGAVQAAHGAALALIAADDADDAAEHPFYARHQLYARGRWPLGLAGRTLNVL